MISDFNRRIEIVKYSFAQDSAGGNTKGLDSVYSIWAQVEQTSGNKALDNMQITYSRAFRVTLRYEDSRPFKTTNDIFYDDNKLIIQSITKRKEGRVNFIVLDTYTTDEQTAALPYFTVDYGWSDQPIDATTFSYQKSTAFLLGDAIALDFSSVTGSSYIAVRYTKNETEKAKWIDTADFNYGVFPDQAFNEIQADQNYYYLSSRVPLALTGPAKKITFSI